VDDVAAPIFAVCASTGRTGSTFLCDLFRKSPIAAVFHGRLLIRVDWTIESPEAMLATYLAQMTERERRVYVEGNPRFLERVAQRHSIDDPCSIVRLVEAQGFSVRCLFMVRSPRGYARSMKSRLLEHGRDAWPPEEQVGSTLSVEAFERVYACPAKWLEDQDAFGRICGSWVLRNRYLKRLMDLPGCHFARFEDVFDGSVSDGDFVQRIQEIHDHFQLPTYADIDHLLEKRRTPRNASQRVEELTDAEEEQLRVICGDDAAAWGYTF
jgi:hypothetical protein